MTENTCILIGAPVQDGTGRLGCDMGPSAFRAAGIGPALESLGYAVRDRGNLMPQVSAGSQHPQHGDPIAAGNRGLDRNVG